MRAFGSDCILQVSMTVDIFSGSKSRRMGRGVIGQLNREGEDLMVEDTS
jgi:hypothetical protein